VSDDAAAVKTSNSFIIAISPSVGMA